MAQTDVLAIQTTDAYGRSLNQAGESYDTGITTGASYADALVIDNRANKELVITFLETGAAQSFKYQILGSIKNGTAQPASSDTSYHTIIADVTVALSSKDYQIITAPWKWIVVQLKNGSGSATVTVRAKGRQG